LDCIPELTPVAGKSGTLLAKRMAAIINNEEKDMNNLPMKLSMCYNTIPTTIYTFPEYGYIV